MTSKRRQLRRSHLCVILDTDIVSPSKIIRIARSALAGGADMLQLRAKCLDFDKAIRLALKLHAMARKKAIPFIVNDRIDIALAIDADGLHIGQADIAIGTAKKLLGDDAIIGSSATNMRQARQAEQQGADYIGVGPVFRTPIKACNRPVGVGLLKAVQKLSVPVFAIGGINIGNIGILTEIGVRKIAVIRAVCASRDPYKNTKQLKKALQG